MTYRKDIDGLRAIAILPVLLFHAGFDPVRGGFVGVDIFFVISGYLITALILKEKEADDFSLLRFYERRARRILPALFFVMLCCLPFAWAWLLPGDLHIFADSMIAMMLFVSNIHFYRETGYFAPEAELQPLLHTWSLSIEEQYYLLFPLLLIALWFLGRKALFYIISIMALLSLLTAQFGGNFWGGDDLALEKFSFTSVPPFGFYLLQTRAWELLAGSLVAFYLHDRTTGREGSEALALTGLAMILYAIFTFDDGTPHPSFHTLLPVAGTALIILFATPKTLCARLLSTPVLVGIGLISYSVYLWHQPLFAFFRIQSEAPPSASAFLVLTLSSLGLGWLSWRYIEQPFRDRQRFSRRQIFRYATVGAGLFLSLGFTGHAYDGFLNRYPPEDRHLIVAADREKMGRYVYKRFKEHLDQPFSQDGRLKVLVIGDSFGQDFINMLAEAKALDHVSLSVHEIASRCGNLYLETDFLHHIEEADRAQCLKDGWYEGERLWENLDQADVVFLASAWTIWAAKLLPKSIENLKKDTDAKIVLIGPKFFGQVNPGQYIGWDDQKKKALIHSIKGSHATVNDMMINHHDDNIFVNVSDLFCESTKECRVFTPDAKLISYDGGHLTKEGAAYLGRKLVTDPLIREALKLDRSYLARQQVPR